VVLSCYEVKLVSLSLTASSNFCDSEVELVSCLRIQLFLKCIDNKIRIQDSSSQILILKYRFSKFRTSRHAVRRCKVSQGKASLSRQLLMIGANSSNPFIRAKRKRLSFGTSSWTLQCSSKKVKYDGPAPL
jgi:hypothetical protein